MTDAASPRPPGRILLFGVYDLGFRALDALRERNLNVVAMVTKPAALLDEGPLTRLARSMHIPLLGPVSPRDDGFLRQVRRLRPDRIAVAGYPSRLPRKLLRIPPLGVVNLHGSLLPRHRGPVPWKWALMNGETRIGFTVHVMTPELDRGPLLTQEACPIEPEDTAETLFRRMCEMAGPLLGRTLLELEAGGLQPRDQDEAAATYESYPSEEDGRICWEWDAESIRNRVRGLSPRPGAWTRVGEQTLRIRKAAHAEGPSCPVPGTVLEQTGTSLLVSTGSGNLRLGEMTIDGGSAAIPTCQSRILGTSPGACAATG
jgi:methionyl-tRNA formyltransferase